MAAITRVEGPMLLANLDRQGTDLQFTTTGESLFYLNFTNFQVGVNTSITSETLTVNGNALITTVKIDKFSTISTTQLNQDLRLVANGTGNVTILGANVISGNIDNVQIGTVIPTHAVFTRANVITKAELKLANVQNLSGNRIVYTAADNTQLEDDEGLQWFASNNTLIAQNFATTQSSLFPSLTSDNITIPTIANNSIVYMAANSQLIGTPTLAYFAGNNLLRVSGNIELGGQNQNRIIYKSTDNKLTTSERLTYDGINFASVYPNANTLGNIRILEDTIQQLQGGTVQGQMNILPYNDPGAGRRLFLGGGTKVTGVATAIAGDSTDTVATIGYVTNAITGAVFSSIEIRQSDTFVRINDPATGTARPNVYVVVDSVQNSEFTNGYANIQNLRIHDGTISTDVGEITIAPIDNGRVRFNTNSSISIPSGVTSERPPSAIAGDLRHNSEHNTLEFSDGVNWNSVAPSIYHQTLQGNGIDTAFTLQRAASDETVMITLNGVVQRPSAAYNVVGNVLTFIQAPAVGDTIDVRFLAYAITYASTPLFVNTPFQLFNTSFVEIDSWNLNQFAGAQYEFIYKNPVNDEWAMGTVYLMHDGVADTYINVKEYSNGTSPYLIFNSYIEFNGDVKLQVKGQNTGNFIKFRVTYFSNDQYSYISWVSQGTVGTFYSNTNPNKSNIYVQLSAVTSGQGNLVTGYTIASGNLPPTAILYANGLILGNAYATTVSSTTTYQFTVTASAAGAAPQTSGPLYITLYP